MRPRREFNDEDRKWIIENYPHLTNRQAREHLQCSFYKLRTFVFECGLEYKTTYQKEVAPVEGRKVWQDMDACGGYCIDCENYRIGGECWKTKRSVGALWQKQCFKGGAANPPCS